MALTRNMLKGMGLNDEQIESIIESHSATVSALKDDRDAYKEEVEKSKDAIKELESLKKKIESDDSHDKLEKLQKEFDDYKQKVTEKESKVAKEEARKNLLSEVGIPEKWRERASRSVSLDEIELDDDGKIKDVQIIKDKLKEEWADVIGTVKTEGANISNPPMNRGKGSMSKEDIMNIKDTNERQKAILENREVFGI